MKGIYITSKNNNKYFYNDVTGIIEVVGHDRNNEEYHEIEYTPKNITGEDVKDTLFSGSGFKSLILEVSQACNLRCKYCIFGNEYKNTRNHSDKLMDISTARSAIDYFVKSIREKSYLNPLSNVNIGFYGGEPLLNFPLIKDSVEYIKTKYPDLNYFHNITTNAMLLNDEIGDFLVENNFSILISLDGDKENHDRNRVTVNGEGSFDKVFNNVNNFIKRHPNYDTISFSQCYDYKTDILKVSKFFNDNDFYVGNSTIISDIETTYFDKFTEEERKSFYEKYKKLESDFENLINTKSIAEYIRKYEMCAIGHKYIDFQLHPVNRSNEYSLIPFTSTCTPGEKLYISIDGKIHICERINNLFSIGDINKGLNFDKIATMINTYNKETVNCSKCNVSKLCNNCFAFFTNEDKLERCDKRCEEIRLSSAETIKKYIELMEENPEEFKSLLQANFIELSKKTNRIFCL